MSDQECLKIYLRELFPISLSSNNRYKLIVILGTLGDFDSIEYVQLLSKDINNLIKHNIDLYCFAIGNDSSKEQFCLYTGLPLDKLALLEDNSIHKSLAISSGLSWPFPSILNLMLMCSGINSPGTLSEVFRGYLGDAKSSQIFLNDQVISTIYDFNIKGSIFNIAGKTGSLRPFELATLRLFNMIEVLSKWHIYMPFPSFLTQRGATFFLDKYDNIVYEYKSNSLLSYSSTMAKPLSFLSDFTSS